MLSPRETHLTGTLSLKLPESDPTSCEYKIPLSYPDTILAGSSILGAASEDGMDAAARFTMEYSIFSIRANRIAASGQGLAVLYDYVAKRKAECIPPGLRTAMRVVEERAAARTEADITALLMRAQPLLSD